MISISIIIPIYNRSELLRTTLRAIRHQSVHPCEIVLSDDGSEENILKEIEAELRLFTIPIIYVRQENKGFRAGTCRNNGVRHASGNILIFNDQDVIFTHDYYRAYLELLKPGRFVVSNPVRLTEEQAGKVTEEMIVEGRFDGVVRKEQIARLKQEWRKDTFYSTCRRLFGLQYYRPKLRSGVFCIHREDIMGVNGFDENYRGWGNEDDDLGRRLYRSGMIGLKVHPEEYPVHLYHSYGHEPGVRVNKEYYQRRIKAIRKGDFFVEKGVRNPAGEDHRLSTIEVESALVSHPEVAEAAAVGRPHELKGEAVAVFVTLKTAKPSEALRKQLKLHVRKEIGALAEPDDIRFTQSLPKTRSGKIMRRLLKDIASGREAVGDTTTLEDYSVLASLRADEE